MKIRDHRGRAPKHRMKVAPSIEMIGGWKWLAIIVGGTSIALAYTSVDWLPQRLLTSQIILLITAAATLFYIWYEARHVVAKLLLTLFTAACCLALIHFDQDKKQKEVGLRSPHLRLEDVVLLLPLEPNKPFKFAVIVKNYGEKGAIQFTSGSVLADHLVSEKSRSKVEAMFFSALTSKADDPIILKPILSFEQNETESWTLAGDGIVTQHDIGEFENGHVLYFMGKGRYLDGQDTNPFEICVFWPAGPSMPSTRCATHNSD